MKKRNCRKTLEEREQHAEATRLRKMTDERLVEEFRNAGGSPRKECSAADFLKYLDSMSGTGNGIGPATVAKLEEVFKRSGL